MENMSPAPFWTLKSLEELTAPEWESLCDRCGRCCLVKLEDEDTGTIHFTDVACTLFDSGACQCADYTNRQDKVSDCIRLTPEQVRTLTWLPPTCGYRLVRDGQPLMWWHPLVSGSYETVHDAGISVRGRISAFEHDIPVEDLLDHLVKWPNKIPKSAHKQSEHKKS
jgi:uncharacterized protein